MKIRIFCVLFLLSSATLCLASLTETIPGDEEKTRYSSISSGSENWFEDLCWKLFKNRHGREKRRVVVVEDYWQEEVPREWVPPKTADFCEVKPLPSPSFPNLGGATDFFDAKPIGGLSNANAIPAPGAIVLGSIGVGLIGWLRRKKTLL